MVRRQDHQHPAAVQWPRFFAQGRLSQFASERHITECLEHIQGLTGDARPAKGNRADVTEHRQQPLRTQDCRALVNAAHRRARDNIVVNRNKRQCGESRELARHSRSLALTDLIKTHGRSTAIFLSRRYHPYAALCSAAREAIVVNDGTDDRFNISIRIQAYKIGIIFLP
jgi:hypothetical protein